MTAARERLTRWLEGDAEPTLTLAADLRTVLSELAAAESAVAVLASVVRAYMCMPIGPMAPSDAVLVKEDWVSLCERAASALTATAAASQAYEDRLRKEIRAEMEDDYRDLKGRI